MRKAAPICERIRANVLVTQAGCWEWQGVIGRGGYGRIKISRGGEKRLALVHRVALEEFKGSIPSGLWALHKCHNRACCNPDHLYAGDRMQNARDMVEAGRSLSGNRQTTFKRTPELIAELNQLRRNGASRKEILARLGIGGRTYDRISKDGLIDRDADRAARTANARAARLRSLGR